MRAEKERERRKRCNGNQALGIDAGSLLKTGQREARALLLSRAGGSVAGPEAWRSGLLPATARVPQSLLRQESSRVIRRRRCRRDEKVDRAYSTASRYPVPNEQSPALAQVPASRPRESVLQPSETCSSIRDHDGFLVAPQKSTGEYEKEPQL